MNKTVSLNRSEVDEYMEGFRQGIHDQAVGVNGPAEYQDLPPVYRSGYADGYVDENCTIYISKDR